MKFSIKSFLILLALTALWYFGFRLPLHREMAEITAQSAVLETQIADRAGKAAAMNAMEAALASADPMAPQVAPYDNLEGVLDQLNTALKTAGEYSLRFSDPAIGKDGTVRRSVVMQFSCDSFAAAEGILQKLTDGPWLCRISGLTLRASNGLAAGPITASATVTFYESQKLEKSR